MKHLQFTLAISKAFFSRSSLQTFTWKLLLSCWLFRSQKHTVTQCFHVHDMIVSSHLYVTHCEKLLYFQNKARYRAENMQAATFVKRLSRDGDINTKVCLHLNFSLFLMTARENREYLKVVEKSSGVSAKCL